MTQRLFHPSYVNVKVVLENYQAATHWPRGTLNALLPVGLGTAHGTSCPSCITALAEFWALSPLLTSIWSFKGIESTNKKKHVTTQCPSLYHQDSSVSCAGSEATAIEKSHWLSERAKNMYEIVRTWKWILVAVQITAGPEGSPSRSLDRKINIVTCCEIRPNNTAVFYLFNAKGQARDVCKLSGSLNIRSPAYHMYNHGHIIYRHYKNS